MDSGPPWAPRLWVSSIYVLDWRDIYPQFEVKKVRLCEQVGMVAMATHWQNIVTGFEVDTYVVLQVIRCRVGSSSASSPAKQARELGDQRGQCRQDSYRPR